MREAKVPRAQIVFGEVVYWFCIAAAIICIIGPLIAMLAVGKNVMNPHYLFATIWEGKNAEAIWQEVGGGFPGGHFWLRNLGAGDAFTQLGLVIGCACALPALLAAALAYVLEKPRAYGWALVSFWVALLITVSALGVFKL